MVMDIEEGNDDTVFGKFPKPTYAAEQMKEIKFPLFSQCNVPGHHDVLKVEEEYIDASCYPNMTAVNRVCESQNCWIGKIFYRGSKVKYENEICTFNRGEPKDRKMYLHNLLLVAKHLPKEIPDVFSDQSDMLSTIKILGLVHQYEDVFNEILNGSGNHTKKTYIATPMLDFTKDLRVAASMAINQHNMKNQGVVRILLVPPSTPVEEKNGRRQESWKEFKVGSYVKRLGKTNMLLIDFEVICPAFARRPLHQKVYFIVYEEDLLNFHTLRLSGVKLGTSMIHDEELQCLTDNVKTREALHSLVYNEDKWDALNWRIVDVRIPGDVMKEDFFHEIESKYKDEKGEVKVVMRNPSPLLSAKYLYPERDPMREVMIKIGREGKVNNGKQETEFLETAENGNLDKMKDCIRNGVNMEARDKYGKAALHCASRYGHLDVVRYLIETCHVDPESKTNTGWTVLHYASDNNHLDIVRYLIGACHVNQEAKTNDKWTALHYACYNGHLDVVRYLIETCHVEKEAKTDDGKTPLHCAGWNGHLDVVRYLIETCHVDMPAKINDGWTALHIASKHGHLGVVRYLIETCQVDQDVVSETRLQIASSSGHLDVLRCLIEAGLVDMEAEDYNEWTELHLYIVRYLIAERHIDKEAITFLGETALHLATGDGHLDVVRYLIKVCHVNMEARDKYGMTALHCASSSGHLDVVRYLIETCHVDQEAKTNYGSTALHCASRYGHLDVVQYLIDSCHVDPEAKTKYEWTALHYASDNGHLDVVKYLIKKYHVDPEAKTKDEWTALQYASYNGHIDIVQYLIKKCHVEKEAKTKDKWTALHYACKNGHLNVVRYLIDTCHVEMEAKTNNGSTALHCASKYGHLNVVRYLIETCHLENDAKNNDGKTAYDLAKVRKMDRRMFRGCGDVVQYLEKLNTDTTTLARTGKGSIPIDNKLCTSIRTPKIVTGKQPMNSPRFGKWIVGCVVVVAMLYSIWRNCTPIRLQSKQLEKKIDTN